MGDEAGAGSVMPLVGVELQVMGDVQGVGYRWYAVRRAQERGLSGWVRNNRDGSVSAYAEGERGEVESFIDDLRQGPPMASVREIKAGWQEYSGSYDGFDIRR